MKTGIEPYTSYTKFKVEPAATNTKSSVEPDSYIDLSVKPARNTVFTVQNTENLNYVFTEESISDITLIYPHPAAVITNTKYKIAGQETISVFDNNGKLMDYIGDAPESNTLAIDISKYPAGNYIYAFGRNSGKFIVK